jgi:hypothetical protein
VPKDVLLDAQRDVVVLVLDFEQGKLVVYISVTWLEPGTVNLFLLKEKSDLFPLV